MLLDAVDEGMEVFLASFDEGEETQVSVVEGVQMLFVSADELVEHEPDGDVLGSFLNSQQQWGLVEYEPHRSHNEGDALGG